MQGHEERLRANVAHYTIVMTEAVRQELERRLRLLPDVLRVQPWILEQRDLNVAERFLALFKLEADKTAGSILVFRPARLEASNGQLLQLVHPLSAAELRVAGRQIGSSLHSPMEPPSQPIAAWWSYAETALDEIATLIERGVL